MKCKGFSGRLLWQSNIVKSVVFDWTARHCSYSIRYCWPIFKLFLMPWFSLKGNKTTDYWNCMTGLSRYNKVRNLFPLNRRSSFRNLLISLKVNKQKKKKKKKKNNMSWRLRPDLRCDFCISFSKDILLLPDPPPPIYLDSFSFCYFLFYSFHFFPLQRQTITMKKMKLGIP